MLGGTWGRLKIAAVLPCSDVNLLRAYKTVLSAWPHCVCVQLASHINASSSRLFHCLEKKELQKEQQRKEALQEQKKKEMQKKQWMEDEKKLREQQEKEEKQVQNERALKDQVKKLFQGETEELDDCQITGIRERMMLISQRDPESLTSKAPQGKYIQGGRETSGQADKEGSEELQTEQILISGN